jgi:hypothetical protein
VAVSPRLPRSERPRKSASGPMHTPPAPLVCVPPNYLFSFPYYLFTIIFPPLVFQNIRAIIPSTREKNLPEALSRRWGEAGFSSVFLFHQQELSMSSTSQAGVKPALAVLGIHIPRTSQPCQNTRLQHRPAVLMGQISEERIFVPIRSSFCHCEGVAVAVSSTVKRVLVPLVPRRGDIQSPSGALHPKFL